MIIENTQLAGGDVAISAVVLVLLIVVSLGYSRLSYHCSRRVPRSAAVLAQG